MWEPNILTDIYEPLLNKINSPEEGRTAESLYRSRRRNAEDNRKTEIVVQRKMRIVLVYKHELSSICRVFVDLDQFACREGHTSSVALIKCKHKWLSWLDVDGW